MNIYIAHSKKMNYQEDLYKPLRNEEPLKKHQLILPHEKSDTSSNDREFYKQIDLFIADCSEKGTGLGIELGWAYDDKTKIYCIYQEGKNIGIVTDRGTPIISDPGYELAKFAIEFLTEAPAFKMSACIFPFIVLDYY